MAVPVINLTQNLLDFPQYQPFAYQPWATGLDATTPPQWAIAANFARRLPDAVVATTTALATSTYANGTDGVGATLTASSNGALSIDSYSAFAAGDVVLVKDESTASRNGLYVVTDPGSSGSPWVLTRHTSMDSTAEMVGFVPVLLGSTNKGRIYLCPPNPVTLGTSAITFALAKNRWTSSDLPPGMELNIATGRLSVSGSGTVPGTYLVGLQASNDSGASWSAEVYVVLNIAARPAPAQNGDDLVVDLSAGAVVGGESAILSTTFGDDLLLRIPFERGGERLDLGTLLALKLGLVDKGSDELVALGGGADGDGKSPPWFGKVGSGSDSVYLLYCKMDGGALEDAIAAAPVRQGIGGSYVDLEAAIERVEPNTTGVGATSLRRTTAPFTLRVFKDDLAN